MTATPHDQPQGDDEHAIHDVLAEQAAAWNRGDAAGFAARVLPDVVFTNILGMFLLGRGPFQEQHARIFSTIYQGSTLSQSLAKLSFVRPDVAIVDTVTAVAGFAHLPLGVEAADGVLRTRLEQVMVRNDGTWWVAGFHNVAINPAFAPGDAPPPE